MKFLLVNGSSFVSKLIKWQTRGHYSHAALRFDDGLVIEAKEFIGVRQLAVSDWIIQTSPNEWQTFEVPATPAQVAAIRAFALAQVGKPYAYGQIARFITRQDYATQPDDKWFCSELVFEAFKRAGLELFRNTEGWEVAPFLLEKSPLAEALA